MEFTVEKARMVKALEHCLSFAEVGATLPILGNVKIEAAGEGKGVKLSATDLEVGIEETIPTKVEGKAGAITLPLKKLKAALSNTAKEERELKFTLLPDFLVKVQCGKLEFKIRGVDASTFPELPKPKGEWSGIVAEVFTSMIKKVEWSVSVDQSKYNLKGIHICPEEDKLRMTATNGSALTTFTRQIGEISGLEGKGIILPLKGAVNIVRIFGNGNAVPILEAQISKDSLFVQQEGIQVCARLLDAKFPDWKGVIPREGLAHMVVANRKELVDCLMRVAQFASNQTHGVVFSLKPGELELSASNPDFGEARESVAAEYTGKETRLGLNAKFALSALAGIETEKVVLKIIDAVSPVQFEPEGDPDHLTLVMSMKL